MNGFVVISRKTLASKRLAPASPPFARPLADIGNQAKLRRFSEAPPHVQAKLQVGAVDDPLEREADDITEAVSRMSAPLASRQCAECEEETLQRKAADCSGPLVGAEGGAAPASIDAGLASPGQALPTGDRAFFEQRFGRDFSAVRVHTGSQADVAAREIGALAYTVGRDIVFANGAYAPQSPAGQKLLAHELTHVVQQRAVTAPAAARDVVDNLKSLANAAKDAAQNEALQRLHDLGDKPAGKSSGYSNPKCPPKFCKPFDDPMQARLDMLWAGPLMLAGIAIKISPKVVPLWAQHIAGGAAPQDLSGRFGADFTNSVTTANTASFLIGKLAADIQVNQTALLGGAMAATVDFTSRLGAAVGEIDDPKSKNRMEFTVIKEIPGNLAGGIGKDETAFPIGAKPSPFNDARDARISASLARQPDGSVLVTPTITFTVRDTIDLCPGNCGATVEQSATVPLSRFEATGLSGDVPFTVNFPAAAKQLAPFIVTPTPSPAPSPVFPQTGPARTTGSLLRIRSGPGLKFPVIDVLGPAGTAVTVTDQQHAEPVNGVDLWDKIDRGWISHAFVGF